MSRISHDLILVFKRISVKKQGGQKKKTEPNETVINRTKEVIIRSAGLSIGGVLDYNQCVLNCLVACVPFMFKSRKTTDPTDRQSS